MRIPGLFVDKQQSKPTINGLAQFGLKVGLLICLSAVTLSSVQAGPREQAKRLHDRLAGIAPTEQVLCAMETLITATPTNTTLKAAADIVTSLTNPPDPSSACNGGAVIDNKLSRQAFYKVTLRDHFMSWSNEAMSSFGDLNDMVATLIGIVRDDNDFREALTGDYLYKGTAAYNPSTNQHYRDLDTTDADLSDTTVLVRETQQNIFNRVRSKNLTPIIEGGVMTTRQAGQEFYSGGTNRLAFRATTMNFICRDLEQLKDPTRVNDRIRQDVTRSPGGDSTIFLNSCIACHAGMDPLAGAFAYYEWSAADPDDPKTEPGNFVYNETMVHDLDAIPPIKHKYLINANNFKGGYVTRDDSWMNYWREGPNKVLGWDINGNSADAGVGLYTMGVEIANTEAFAKCQVEKVYKSVCLQEPIAAHATDIQTIVGAFKTGYDLKTVFKSTAALCAGQ